MRTFASTFLLCLAVPGLAIAAQPATGTAGPDWSGFYVGAHVGERVPDGSLSLSTTDISPLDSQPDHAFNPSLSGNDFVGGLLLGYNYQIGSLVLGVEGDVGFASGKSTVFAGKTGVPTSIWYTANDLSLDTDGHIRARLGYAAGPFLLYGSAGLALASGSVKVTGYCPPGTYSGSASTTLTGASLGAGVEYAVSRNISLRAEYVFDDYGNQSYAPSNDQPGDDWQARLVSLQTHTFRAAISYRF